MKMKILLIFLFTACSLCRAERLFTIPNIEGLTIGDDAKGKILSENLQLEDAKRNYLGEKIEVTTPITHLDDNCKALIDRFSELGQEFPRRKTIKHITNTPTNQSAHFIDANDKRVFNSIGMLSYSNTTISIQVNNYVAYGVYQGPTYNRIEEVEYERDSIGSNVFFHSLTLGTMLLSPFERQFSFGCKTRRISQKYIDTNNSSFIGKLALFRERSAHILSVNVISTFENIETDAQGTLNLKLPEEIILNSPENGIVKLNIKCKTCRQDPFFGSSTGSPGHYTFEINVANDRKLANRKKIIDLFRTELTDWAFARLDSFNSLDHKVAEQKYNKMISENHEYGKTIQGFFEYLQDEFEANKSGKSIREQRNLRLAAANEKNRLEKLAQQREANDKAAQQSRLSNHIKSCEKYLQQMGLTINRYTGVRSQLYDYLYRGDITGYMRSKYGQNVVLLFILRNLETRRDRDVVCIVDPKSSSVLGIENDR